MIAASGALSAAHASTLHEHGFVVVPGPFAPAQLTELASAYDAAEAAATGDDLKIGSTTTRVSDFVNRVPAVESLYTFPPLLDACAQVIGPSFKLSSLHSRTLRPATPNQSVHVDVRRDSTDWPLLAFILMVDEFRLDNGATRFIPGSHRLPAVPDDSVRDVQADLPGQVVVCGSAGSLLIFDGSTWHGHTANISGRPRRSLQGAFIPRNGSPATDFAARMKPENRAQLPPLAIYILAM